jgi:hypothetical protein
MRTSSHDRAQRPTTLGKEEEGGRGGGAPAACVGHATEICLPNLRPPLPILFVFGSTPQVKQRLENLGAKVVARADNGELGLP